MCLDKTRAAPALVKEYQISLLVGSPEEPLGVHSCSRKSTLPLKVFPTQRTHSLKVLVSPRCFCVGVLATKCSSVTERTVSSYYTVALSLGRTERTESRALHLGTPRAREREREEVFIDSADEPGRARGGDGERAAV